MIPRKNKKLRMDWLSTKHLTGSVFSLIGIIIVSCLFSCQHNPEPSEGPTAALQPAQAESTQIKPEDRVNWKRIFRDRNPLNNQNRSDELSTSTSESSDHSKTALSSTEEVSRLLALRQVEEARSQISRLLQTQDQNPELWIQLIKADLLQMKIDYAYRNLETLRRLLSTKGSVDQGHDIVRQYLLAKTFVLDGQHSKGRDTLNLILQRDPGFIPAYVLMAESLVREQQISEARYVLTQGVDRGGDDPDLFAFLGFVEMASGDLKKAHEWLDRANSMDSRNTYARCLAVSLHLEEGKPEAAEILATKTVAEDPSSDQALLLLARTQIITGKLQNARSTLQVILKTNPKNIHARFLLGVSYEKEDQNLAKSYFSESMLYLESNDPMYKYAELSLERFKRDSREQH